MKIQSVMKRGTVIAGVLMLPYVNILQGQDVHFSQYYASPMTLNPALTGSMEGKYRFGMNYRNQWNGLVDFNTMSGFADAVILKGKLGEDWIGGGLLFVSDKRGDGGLTTTRVLGGGAYHKALEGGETHYISGGAGIGYSQWRVDFSNLLFQNQLNGDAFDPTLSNGEPVERSSFGYVDIQAGLLWFFAPAKTVNMHAGIGFFHAGTPDESFLSGMAGANQRGLRTVVHGGSMIRLTDVLELRPGAMWEYDRRASETVLGALAGYGFLGDSKKRGIAYAGLWYRLGDALIPTAGLEYESVRAGVSYDLTLSSLREANNGQGGPEVSLTYELPLPSRRGAGKVSCPRF